MEPARSIGKLGFKRWYERQLLESHAWLITCLLCGFAAVALIEGVSFRQLAAESLLRVGAAFAAGLLCWHGLRRYAEMIARANRFAEGATCGACGTYARFEVLDENARMRVRCRNCSHEWQFK